MTKQANVRTGWRFHLIFLFLLGIGAIIGGRLVFLQILNNGFYQALAQGQQNVASFAKGERGSIFAQDKHGNLYALASNQSVPFAFASPAEIGDAQKAASRVAEILQLDEASILPRLENKESLFEVLKKRVSNQEKERIENLALSGVYIGKEQVRSYPQGQLAAHVIGFTNQDGQGQYGVEEYYQHTLEGKEGFRGNASNPASYLLAALNETLQNGSDLVLTIDYNVQSLAESLLKEAQANLRFHAGTIIVADPQTGKILALANVPSFDPNAYFLVEDLELLQNPAVQKLFEPGSVMKAITMAAGLDANVLSPETTYYDAGTVTVSGKVIYNYENNAYGKQSMAGVLAHSINTGAVFAEKQLGHTTFLSYLEKFGFFEPTNIDEAGEAFSENRVLKTGYDINFATASFGQGIELTPLQLVRAYTALAADGILQDLFLVEQPGNEKRGEERRVISQKAAADVTGMLVNAVEENNVAKIPGYSIAGKTGTAQIPWSVLGVRKAGYSEQTIQSFIAYFPAYDPQFLILVKLDRPQTKAAGASAIPVFKDLATYLIHYYQIPPDYEEVAK